MWINRLLSVFLGIALVTQYGVPTTAFASESGSAGSEVSESAEPDGESNAAEQNAAEAQDITEAWKQGDVTLSEAGYYVLSDDVETGGILTIAAEQGVEITLDFMGHSVVVQGGVYAGIDVGASRGSVVLTDSTFDAEAQDGPAASLTVEANGVDGNVFGVIADYGVLDEADGLPSLQLANLNVAVNLNTVSTEAEQATHDAYGLFVNASTEENEPVDLAVGVDGCSVAASINLLEASDRALADELANGSMRVLEEADVGTAYGICTTVLLVSLDGSLSTSVQSSGATYDLYSTQEGSFSWGASLSCENELSVCVAGNAEGVVVASVDEGLENAGELVALLANAVNGNGFGLVGGNVVVVAVSQEMESGSCAEEPDDPTCEHYALPGWYFDEVLTEAYDFPELVTSELTLCAKLAESGSGETETKVFDLYELLCEGSVTLTEPGIYYLSQSYGDDEGETARSITISPTSMTETGEFVIDLCGNSLASYGITATASKTGIGVNLSLISTATDYVTGAQGEANQGKLELKGFSRRIQFAQSLGALRLDSVDVVKTDSNEQATSSFKYSIALDVSQASGVSISNCSISVDLSNQINGGSTPSSFTTTNCVRAVDIASSVGFGDVSISNSSISAKAGKPVVTSTAQTSVNAVALFVRGCSDEETVTVSDSTLSAHAAYGSAIALCNFNYYAKNPSVVLAGNSVTLEATSESAASTETSLSLGALSVVGLHGVTVGSKYASDYGSKIYLDTKVCFNSESTTNAYALAADEATLAASDAAFVVCDGFSSDGSLPVVAGLEYNFNGSGTTSYYPVLPTGVASGANASGYYLASFDVGLSGTQKEEAAACLQNGVSGSSTGVASDVDGLVFCSDATDPEATITRDGTVIGYSTVDEALRAVEDGDTVVLAKNINYLVSYSVTDGAAKSFSVDLNGYSLAAFQNTSDDNVTLCSSAESQPAMTGASSDAVGGYAAIVQAGSGSLTVDGIAVSIAGQTGYVYAAYLKSGTLNLDGVSIDVEANYEAMGIYASGGTLDVNGGSVSVSQTTTAAANGVNLASSLCTASVEGCAVSVSSSSSNNLYALRVRSGSVVASGSTFAVSATGSGQSAYGVYANESVALDGCTVAVEAAGEKSNLAAWCLYLTSNGKATLAGESTFTLPAGTTGGHVYLSGNPLSLGDTFSLASGSDAALTVGCVELTDDIVAQPASDGSALTAAQAALFKVVDDDSYTYYGYVAKADENGNIVFVPGSDEGVARIGETYYLSLTAALAAADDGDTVVLVADDVSSAAVTTTKNVTVDLAGKSLTVTASDSSTTGAAGIAVTGGRLSLVDTSEDATGTLAINLRLTKELSTSSSDDAGTIASARSAGNGVKGISVSSGGSLSIDGCTVRVYCSGTGDAWALSGIYVGQGAVNADSGDSEEEAAVSLESTNLIVNNVSALDTSVLSQGARIVYGIYNDQTNVNQEIGDIELDGDSKISVTSTADVTAQEGSGWSSQNNGAAWLREVAIDTESAFYKEVCELFLAKASYDSTNSSNSGHVHGAQIYYAVPLTLSDGTYVWAFSDVVTGDNVGDPDYIVPSHIFVESGYDVPPDAMGIAASDSAYGDVTVNGSVSAVSKNGNAYALNVAGAAQGGIPASTWTVGSGADLTSTSESYDTYLKQDDSYIDLEKIIGATASWANNKHFYPKSSNQITGVAYEYTEAVAVKQSLTTDQAANYAASQLPQIVLSGDLSMSTSGVSSIDILADSVNITSDLSVEEALSIADHSGETARGQAFALVQGLEKETEADETLCSCFEDATGVYSPAIEGQSLVWGDLDLTTDCILTFAGARDADGNLLDTASVVVGSGSLLGDDGEALGKVPTPSNYTKGGATYMFVGWRHGVSSSVTRVLDPACLDTFEVDGSYSFTAYYVKVGSDQQLVTFKVEDYLFAYAVDEGSIPSIAGALTANSVTYTDATATVEGVKSVTGQNWSFAGWRAGYYDVRDDDYDTDDLCTLSAVDLNSGDSVCYTAQFSYEGPTSVSVKLYYYNNSNGSWSYSEKERTVYYGADISLLREGEASEDLDAGLKDISIVSYATYTGSQWVAHRFLGWSTRRDDTQALDSGTLPLAGSGTGTSSMSGNTNTYYAIYSSEPMYMNVTFVIGDETVTTEVSASSTLSEAATAAGLSDTDDAENGCDAPEAPDGMVFVGWAASADGTAIGNPSLSKLTGAASAVLPEDGDGKYYGEVTYYAVFADAPQVNVLLHGCTDDGWTDKEFTTDKGTVIDVDDLGYSDPWKMGYVFVGWNTAEGGSGSYFDIRRNAVSDVETLELWAQYVAVETSVADGVALDLSSVYVNASAALGATAAEASMTEADGADSRIAVESTYYVALEPAYTFALTVTGSVASDSSDATTAITTGFGSANVSVPVSDDLADRTVRAYLVSADGTVATLACTVEDGVATFTIPGSVGYANTTGNVVLAYALTSAERSLANTKASLKAQLQDLFDSYYEGNYDSADYDELCQILEDGLAAIDAAATTDAATAAAEGAAADMAAVPSTVDLDQAKASALVKLADAYAGYSSGDYTTDSWNALVEAYTRARAAINAATTSEEASAAASSGVLAMLAITPDASDDAGNNITSTTGSTTSSGTSGTTSSSSGSNGSSSSGLTSSGSSSSGLATTSSSSSGLSSSGSSLASTGTVGAASQSMLGAVLSDIDDTLAEQLGVEAGSGVYVESVEEGGALANAGVKAGDIITAINGEEVASLEDLDSILSGMDEGDSVTVDVLRDGEEISFSATLDADTSGSTFAGSGLSSDDEGSEEGEETAEQGNSVLKWIQDNLVLVVVLALVLLALVAGLAWWLLTRRNRNGDGGGDDDDDFYEEEGDETTSFA